MKYLIRAATVSPLPYVRSNFDLTLARHRARTITLQGYVIPSNEGLFMGEVKRPPRDADLLSHVCGHIDSCCCAARERRAHRVPPLERVAPSRAPCDDRLPRRAVPRRRVRRACAARPSCALGPGACRHDPLLRPVLPRAVRVRRRLRHPDADGLRRHVVRPATPAAAARSVHRARGRAAPRPFPSPDAGRAAPPPPPLLLAPPPGRAPP